MADESAPFASDFKRWADSFPSDARLFGAILAETRLAASVRRLAAGALNYMLLQLDVVPDHLPVIGVLDDAFVLRTAAALILEQDAAGTPTELARLANDDEKIRSFLGRETHDELRKFVEGLQSREVRKRAAGVVVDSEKERRHFLQEIDDHLAKTRGGSVDDPARLERDLRSYFKAKLGRI